MSWDEFWQIYNRLYEAKLYKQLIAHWRQNWNVHWVKPRIDGSLDK